MPTRVRDEGSRSARIVLIGEAPGEREDAAGRPFVGPSGAALADWWRQVGLQRSDFYITNVVPYRPPNNDITKVDKDDLVWYEEELHARLAALDDPWLIVPTGNVALKALTGKTGIFKHRGSIYETSIGTCSRVRDIGGSECRIEATERASSSALCRTWARERPVKIIPTIHPAATFRDPRLVKRCLRDWQRIAGDCQFRELRLPVREHYIRPTLADVEHYVHLVEHEADTLALDIETPHGQWTCIGFSYDPSFSITIPLTRGYWGEALPDIWAAVRCLLGNKLPKVMQNGLFDSYYIRRYGFDVVNWQWDTLAMHHALEPVDEHSLAYMASIDTREPFWKDEAKDPTEMAKYTRDQDAFWVYNGKDVAVTQELCEVYEDRLKRGEENEQGESESIYSGRIDDVPGDGEGHRGNQTEGIPAGMERPGGRISDEGNSSVGSRLAFYQRHYRDMFEPLLGMSLSGIRLDDNRRQSKHAALAEGARKSLATLAELAGEPLHAKTGLSPVKLKRFMYETLGLPKQVNRSRGSVTTDETAIRRLMRRYPEKFEAAGREILNFRRTSKLATFMQEGLADDDGYVRCQYRFTTDTGRLSSSSNPMGTGMNLQNVDREARDIFFPRPGHILLEVDASQAEDRWVKTIAYANRDKSEQVIANWQAEIVEMNRMYQRQEASRQAAHKFIEERKQLVHALKTCDWDEVLWRARAQPWENDEHWRAADLIFGLPRDQMTKDYHRYLGKRTRHAVNYGEGPNKFAEVLMNDEVYVTPSQAKQMIEALKRGDPYIEVYQFATRQEIIAKRQLDNSWGRWYDFTYMRLDDAAYRKGYAFRPQSEVADLENQWAVIPLYQWLKQEGMESMLMAQVHDAVLVSCKPEEAWEVYQFLRESLTRPRVFRGVELVIPVEVALGLNWAEKEGFKHEPSENDFRGLIDRLISRCGSVCTGT